VNRKAKRYVTDLLGQSIANFIKDRESATFPDILLHLQERSNVTYTPESQKVVADKLNKHPAFCLDKNGKWVLAELREGDFTRAVV